MTPLLLLLNLLLLTRMVYLRSDGPLGFTANLSVWVIQISALFLACTPNSAAWWVAALLTLCFALNTIIERAGLDLARGWRWLVLLLMIVGCTGIHQGTAGLKLSWMAAQAAETVPHYLGALLPKPAHDLPRLDWLLFGLLLLANETNILIRAAFRALGLEPRLDTRVQDPYEVKIDEQEYQAGRAIGILERWLMYLVVVSESDLTAIGLIVGVKGLVRFKRLERDKDDRFAEYLLVGTLLSTLFSIVVGYWVVAMA